MLRISAFFQTGLNADSPMAQLCTCSSLRCSSDTRTSVPHPRNTRDLRALTARAPQMTNARNMTCMTRYLAHTSQRYWALRKGSCLGNLSFIASHSVIRSFSWSMSDAENVPYLSGDVSITSVLNLLFLIPMFADTIRGMYHKEFLSYFLS